MEVQVPDGAPEGAILALPGDGRIVYRLIKSDLPNSGDFQPQYGKRAAAELGIAELLRLGISHFLSLDDAQGVNVKGSRVARVSLKPGCFHFARMGDLRGHINVWGRPEDFVQFAQIEE